MGLVRPSMVMVPSRPPHPCKESSYVLEGEGEKEDKEEGKTSEGKRKGDMIICQQWGFPRKSVGKESAYSAGDPGSIPGS